MHPGVFAITAPDQPKEVLDATLEIKATAEAVGNHPITAVRLLMDGRPYLSADALQKFAQPRKQAPVSWKVELPPGTHTFAVQAESAVSKAVSAPVEITYAAEQTALGLMMIGATDRGICFLQFGESEDELAAALLKEYPKALVEANRATFTIKSAVNAGTLVEITFPATRVLAE